MDGVAPPLLLLSCVKRSIEKGQSVKMGVLVYLKKSNQDFTLVVTQWLGLLQQGKDTVPLIQTLTSIHRRTLLHVLERGLKGESIYNVLIQLEDELVEACNEEISRRLAMLPLIMLAPLLLFQFPAFLILLFAPLMQNFFHSLGSQ